MKTDQAEKFAEQVSSMDRQSLIRLLRRFQCKFEMDFTDEFLNKMSLPRLRHIVVGAMLHAENVPAAFRKARR